MIKFKRNLLALAVSLAVSAGALADGTSKDDYKAGSELIEARYDVDKAGCAPLAGNAQDICLAEAKRRQQITTAELEARHEPTRETHHDAHIVKAEADYEVAKERCDNLAGNTKDVCMKEAKAAKTITETDADGEHKTAQAQAKADEKSADAVEDAQHKVAREKCDNYAGNAQDLCLSEAKAGVGQ